MLGFRFCLLIVILVITLTLCVIECPVRTPTVERHANCLPGYTEAISSIQTMSRSTSVVAMGSELNLVWDTVFCPD